MAYLTITRISGDADNLAEGYLESSEVMTAVGRDHGLIAHAAARADDGLVIVNLWPSSAGSEAAARDPRRAAVMAHHGLGPTDFHREHYDVVGYEVPDAR